MSQPSSLLVALTCSLANGPYQAWGAALPTIWAHLDYKRTQTDILSFASMAAYTVGCYLVGELGDRVFRGRLKQLLCLLLAAALLSFLWLCLMLPSFIQQHPLLQWGFVPVVIAVFLTGAFVGATSPIAMELCAEVTFPAQEGISGNFIIFVTQVFTVIMLFAAPHIDPLVTTPMMGVTMMMCVLS